MALGVVGRAHANIQASTCIKSISREGDLSRLPLGHTASVGCRAGKTHCQVKASLMVEGGGVGQKARPGWKVEAGGVADRGYLFHPGDKGV